MVAVGVADDLAVIYLLFAYQFLSDGDIKLPANPFISKLDDEGLAFPEDDDTVGCMNLGEILLSRLVF